MNIFEHLLPIDSRFELIGQDTTATHMHFYFHSRSQSACCTKCQEVSTRRHSSTKRKIRDLPISGKEVYLHIRLNKWFCPTATCSTTIFTKTINAAPAYQRNTVRVNECLRELAFRSNCVQAAKLSKKLSLSVSHDTLPRLIYQTPMPEQTSPFPCD
ncbi:transposase family protein [Metasolibacillus fluoroglycofenilyticus]|uniref:transposase family protein n=1 Tax=Metasolibacillus fluoroglycofenilyticus TaxID=1239396 RepID=UPI000D337A7E